LSCIKKYVPVFVLNFGRVLRNGIFRIVNRFELVTFVPFKHLYPTEHTWLFLFFLFIYFKLAQLNVIRVIESLDKS
ncbi:Uncharacterized protein APZ42_002768, partial [Daphnia magna]